MEAGEGVRSSRDKPVHTTFLSGFATSLIDYIGGGVQLQRNAPYGTNGMFILSMIGDPNDSGKGAKISNKKSGLLPNLPIFIQNGSPLHVATVIFWLPSVEIGHQDPLIGPCVYGSDKNVWKDKYVEL